MHQQEAVQLLFQFREVEVYAVPFCKPRRLSLNGYRRKNRILMGTRFLSTSAAIIFNFGDKIFRTKSHQSYCQHLHHEFHTFMDIEVQFNHHKHLLIARDSRLPLTDLVDFDNEPNTSQGRLDDRCWVSLNNQLLHVQYVRGGDKVGQMHAHLRTRCNNTLTKLLQQLIEVHQRKTPGNNPQVQGILMMHVRETNYQPIDHVFTRCQSKLF